MKKTEQQERYSYFEFEDHLGLWNLIPCGNGNSLVLLRKLCNSIQSNCFKKLPSILIVGPNSELFARGLVNSLCSDTRILEARYICVDDFCNTSKDTVYLINNIDAPMFCEETLYYLVKNRFYKYKVFKNNSKYYDYIQVNSLIILTAQDIKFIPTQMVSAVDFKVFLEPYTKEQHLLYIHQKLKFCSISYGNDEKVLESIRENAKDDTKQINEILKTSILYLQDTNENILTLDIVKKAVHLLQTKKK